jgi:hypothetical protein
MPSAIEQIVNTYVRLNNRRALEAMLIHRQRLAISIEGKVYDRSPVIENLDEDIAAIQAGLKRLTATSRVLYTEMAPAPAAGWSR